MATQDAMPQPSRAEKLSARVMQRWQQSGEKAVRDYVRALLAGGIGAVFDEIVASLPPEVAVIAQLELAVQATNNAQSQWVQKVRRDAERARWEAASAKAQSRLEAAQAKLAEAKTRIATPAEPTSGHLLALLKQSQKELTAIASKEDRRAIAALRKSCLPASLVVAILEIRLIELTRWAQDGRFPRSCTAGWLPEAVADAATHIERWRADDTVISVAKLKERGWTEVLIKRHLGDADVLVDNPHYKTAAPMRLFRLRRVEAMETKADVAAGMVKAAWRNMPRKAAVH